MRSHRKLAAAFRVEALPVFPDCLPSADLLRRTVRLGASSFLFLLLAILLPVRAGFAAGPPVLVLNDTNAPPYTNQERTGYLDVIATEAFRRAGLELRLIKLPAERALRLVNDGHEDGDLTRIAGIETQYPNLIRVPAKLTDWDFAAFSKDPSVPADLTAIRGRAVGYLRGWKFYEQAMAGGANAIAVDDAEQLFRLLQTDRIEVALYVRWMGLALVKKQGIEAVRPLQPLLAKREMFIYLNKRHAGHAPRIAAALRALKKEGFYERANRERLLPFAAAVKQ